MNRFFPRGAAGLRAVACGLVLPLACVAHATLGDASLLGTGKASEVALVQAGNAAPLAVSADDRPGVQRAAADLQTDIERVTGTEPALGTGAAAPLGGVKVEVHLAPSLDFQAGEGLRYAISMDEEPPQVVEVGTWASLQSWKTEVAESVRRVTTTHALGGPGKHVLKFWFVTPGVVLERIVIAAAPVRSAAAAGGPRGRRPVPGVRPSYLGPPESPRVRATPSSAAISASQPLMRSDRTSQLAHAQLLEKARSGKIDLYFLGDSITRRWGATDYPEFLAHWKRTFHGWNAANFGWGADRVQNMLWRVENGELDGVNPKVIVILAGTNNVGEQPGDEAKVADIAQGIATLVDLCRKKAPGAVVVLTAIFPRNDNRAVVPTINRINAEIAKLADGKSVRFLNLNDRLADAQGELHEGVAVDGLHLSLRGYQIWADALRPVLTELLGPPAPTDEAPPPTGDPSAKGMLPRAERTVHRGPVGGG